VIAERFRGHSISDPGLYRSKDNLKEVQTKDPIIKLKEALIAKGFITEEEFQALNKQYRDEAAAAMDYAEASPWPELSCLGDDVYARD
jgi:pyruvate dehydrogenase E1 component alpha subunit